MSSKTASVSRAFARYARAYEQFHFDKYGMRIKVLAPRILFLPGVGYEINDKIYRMTAQQLIASYEALIVECETRISTMQETIAASHEETPRDYQPEPGIEPIPEDDPAEADR